jgi:hypothetical protein
MGVLLLYEIFAFSLLRKPRKSIAILGKNLAFFAVGRLHCSMLPVDPVNQSRYRRFQGGVSELRERKFSRPFATHAAQGP